MVMLIKRGKTVQREEEYGVEQKVGGRSRDDVRNVDPSSQWNVRNGKDRLPNLRE